MFMIRV